MDARTKRWMSVGTAIVGGALVVTGCSDAEGNRSTASPARVTPSRTSGPPLTAAQLKALAFKDSEVPQSYDAPVEPASESEDSPFPPVSVASCQRVFDVLDAKTKFASTNQIFNWKDNVLAGGITLASYEGAKAQEAFHRLQDSLKTCKTFTGVAWAGKYHAKITVENAPDVGDEALNFHLISPARIPGKNAVRDDHVVFVRVGNVTASFDDLAVGQKAEFPSDLITKQVDRLRGAQPGHRASDDPASAS
jgi:hypothetical protein